MPLKTDLTQEHMKQLSWEGCGGVWGQSRSNEFWGQTVYLLETRKSGAIDILGYSRCIKAELVVSASIGHNLPLPPPTSSNLPTKYPISEQ